MTGTILQGRDLEHAYGTVSLDCDTLVVGSGTAGAVVAATRAALGERVLILEEGRHVSAAEHGAMRPSESLRSVWRGGGMTAAFGIGDTPVINVTMGRAVGGSSLLTGGVCFRTPDDVLDLWVNERGLRDLSPELLRPYFEQVEADAHIGLVPPEMRSRSTKLFDEGARHLGYALHPTRRNTRGCVGASTCNFGCPNLAKKSVDLTYLPRALKDGATLISDCLVQRLTFHGRRATGAVAALLDAHGKRRGQLIAHAERVVLACGAAHTPLLLMRNGVGRRSPVGRHMTLHPSFRMLARFDAPVTGWRGAMQSAFSDHFEDERVTLMSVFVPPFAIAAGVPGIGPAFMERIGQLDHLAMFGGLIHDEGGGRVVRVPGREPLLIYRMAREDRASIPRILRRLGEAYFAAGAVELYTPVLGHAPVDADAFRRMDLASFPARRFECSSQHPLGSCRMGTERRNSVVDDLGRVWDTGGLYVADGAVLPSSLGVNPQQTIMAMALRLAERMPRVR